MNSENKSISKSQLDELAASITGSTFGIGYEIEIRMAEAGASVHINDRAKDVQEE